MKARTVVAILAALAVSLLALALLDEDVRKIEFHRFPTRASWQLPARVIEALDLSDGARVADLGAGGGYFVSYLSEAIGGRGRLYAVDIDAGVVEALREKIESEGLDNAEAVKATSTDPNLADGLIDLVFLCDVYHHIANQESYFADLRRDLSPEGRVAIVEPRAQGFGSFLSPAGHATLREDLVREMEQAGYRLEQGFDFLPVQNLLIFRPSG